jgi:hypothetical protein
MEGFYEVDVWGPVQAGTFSTPRLCTMSGFAKVSVPAQPYLVPNEFICGRLGLLMGLPVPPGVCTKTDSGDLAYVALRFGHRGEKPPPVIPEHVVADNPSEAAGIIVFDCWIANKDRHNQNLAFVRGGTPLHLFDHGNALLGEVPGKGPGRLHDLASVAVVSACLGPHITSSQSFAEWQARAMAIPDGLVRDLIRAVTAPGGLTKDDAEVTFSFLIERRGKLRDLLRSAASQLPKISDWGAQQ